MSGSSNELSNIIAELDISDIEKAIGEYGCVASHSYQYTSADTVLPTDRCEECANRLIAKCKVWLASLHWLRACQWNKVRWL